MATANVTVKVADLKPVKNLLAAGGAAVEWIEKRHPHWRTWVNNPPGSEGHRLYTILTAYHAALDQLEQS